MRQGCYRLKFQPSLGSLRRSLFGYNLESAFFHPGKNPKIGRTWTGPLFSTLVVNVCRNRPGRFVDVLTQMPRSIGSTMRWQHRQGASSIEFGIEPYSKVCIFLIPQVEVHSHTVPPVLPSGRRLPQCQVAASGQWQNMASPKRSKVALSCVSPNSLETWSPPGSSFTSLILFHAFF